MKPFLTHVPEKEDSKMQDKSLRSLKPTWKAKDYCSDCSGGKQWQVVHGASDLGWDQLRKDTVRGFIIISLLLPIFTMWC